MGGSIPGTRVTVTSMGKVEPSLPMAVSSNRRSRISLCFASRRGSSSSRYRSRRSGGNDEIDELGAERLLGGVAERPLGGPVELENAAATVDRHHAIERPVQDGGLEAVRLVAAGLDTHDTPPAAASPPDMPVSVLKHLMTHLLRRLRRLTCQFRC